MKITIFGLSISSSWGNGHATIWRGLIRELVRLKHAVIFFEKDVPYYASNRDLIAIDGMQLILYKDWKDIRDIVCYHLTTSDIAIVTSYCPDAIAASELMLESKSLVKVFYDLDSPVTLNNISNGKHPGYIGTDGLKKYDTVFSFTGGIALDLLYKKLEARRVFPLYGCVDINVHYQTDSIPTYNCDLSYMGTYSDDRHDKLMQLFVNTATHEETKQFIVAGALYPPYFFLPRNVFHFEHIPPSQHSVFFSSSRYTLNLTRGAMAEMGYCPSGRLFEAAACQVPILSDWWEGLDTFFEPDKEIIIVNNDNDVSKALNMSDDLRQSIYLAAYSRVRNEHTAQNRTQTLLSHLEKV